MYQNRKPKPVKSGSEIECTIQFGWMNKTDVVTQGELIVDTA